MSVVHDRGYIGLDQHEGWAWWAKTTNHYLPSFHTSLSDLPNTSCSPHGRPDMVM
jgi:hypothetical protein